MREFRYNNFDAIRLFAALQVVVVHAIAHLDVDPTGTVVKWLRLFPGVAIFFVISGFLISASFERTKSIQHYFTNRALRIFPALWVCLIISTAIAWFFEGFSLTSGDFFAWFAAQATFFQFYNPEFLRQFGLGVLNGSLWTIPVELQFYLSLPVLIIVLRIFNWRWAVCLAFMLVMIASNLALMSVIEGLGVIGKLIKVSILPHLYLFFAGILLQRYFKHIIDFACKYLWVTLLVYLSAAYICNSLGIGYLGNEINPVSALILAFLVVGAGYSKVPQKPWLKGFDISYGVYIYHAPFINLFLEIQGLSVYQRFICVLLLTLVAATASWTFVEKPALSLKPASLKKRPLVSTEN